jgi:hypothetical protein
MAAAVSLPPFGRSTCMRMAQRRQRPQQQRLGAWGVCAHSAHCVRAAHATLPSLQRRHGLLQAHTPHSESSAPSGAPRSCPSSCCCCCCCWCRRRVLLLLLRLLLAVRHGHELAAPSRTASPLHARAHVACQLQRLWVRPVQSLARPPCSRLLQAVLCWPALVHSPGASRARPGAAAPAQLQGVTQAAARAACMLVRTFWQLGGVLA